MAPTSSAIIPKPWFGLQGKRQSHRGSGNVSLPTAAPPTAALGLSHLVCVDPARHAAIEDCTDRQAVSRVIRRLITLAGTLLATHQGGLDFGQALGLPIAQYAGVIVQIVFVLGQDGVIDQPVDHF